MNSLIPFERTEEERTKTVPLAYVDLKLNFDLVFFFAFLSLFCFLLVSSLRRISTTVSTSVLLETVCFSPLSHGIVFIYDNVASF